MMCGWCSEAAARFANQPFGGNRVRRHVGAQHFERDVTAQIAVDGLVDHRHAALSKATLNLIPVRKYRSDQRIVGIAVVGRAHQGTSTAQQFRLRRQAAQRQRADNADANGKNSAGLPKVDVKLRIVTWACQQLTQPPQIHLCWQAPATQVSLVQSF